jgi:hypothetical protein
MVTVTELGLLEVKVTRAESVQFVSDKNTLTSDRDAVSPRETFTLNGTNDFTFDGKVATNWSITRAKFVDPEANPLTVWHTVYWPEGADKIGDVENWVPEQLIKGEIKKLAPAIDVVTLIWFAASLTSVVDVTENEPTTTVPASSSVAPSSAKTQTK